MTNEPTAPDLREIALEAMKDAVRTGESHEMCARWISERYTRALLPAPIPQGEDGWLDALEAAAKKATPKRWKPFLGGRFFAVMDMKGREVVHWSGLDASLTATSAAKRRDLAKFIALANPKTILRLIAIARAAGGKQ